jgi:nucleotide-binding universal stress UspA family protein
MSANEHVLVGLGYDDDGRPELGWAAREAQARGAALRVVRSYDVSEVIGPWFGSPDSAILDDLRGEAEQAVDGAVSQVRTQWPEVQVTGQAVDGMPAKILVEASRDAAVTVLGGRQLSALGAAVLGSVSCVVSATASGPVVVVGQHGDGSPPDAAVVVGVDGSDQMDDVLEFAFEYASRHGRALHAVACWRHTPQEITPWPPPLPPAERAAHWLADAFRTWREKYPAVVTSSEVVHGHPVGALVAVAKGQDLLVVGNRSKHAHVAALLGSVAQGVLHHAQCPVAVVHHPRRDG